MNKYNINKVVEQVEIFKTQDERAREMLNRKDQTNELLIRVDR